MLVTLHLETNVYMSNKLPIYLLGLLLAMSFPACNSDREGVETVAYSSVAVEGFSLSKNDSVLADLDSVFFSIDLATAQIYNADSLPKGTDVSRLVVNIKTNTVGAVDLIVHRGGILGDTTYNYLANQKDSIDFSYGPVTLRVTAQDGSQTRDYDLRVNVHTTNPDSLMWNLHASRTLPTSLREPNAARAVRHDDKAYCLTTDVSGAACLAVTDAPSGSWTMSTPSLPAGAVVRNFAATDNAFYITDIGENLYTSTDAITWTPTGTQMATVFGGCGDTLLGVRRGQNADWILTGYPAFAETAAPDDFPVRETSQLLVYTTKWSDNPTAIMAGGLMADGTPTGATWGWDGTQWASLSLAGPALTLPAMSGVTLVPFFAFNSSEVWNVSRQTVILALGGRRADWTVGHDAYISWDRGVTWKPVDTPMHLPDYLPAFAGASALVFDSRLDAESIKQGNPDWTVPHIEAVPRWWALDQTQSRVAEAITSWDCPYIYMFGGYDDDGALINNLWRATVNRLTFRPLY